MFGKKTHVSIHMKNLDFSVLEAIMKWQKGKNCILSLGFMEYDKKNFSKDLRKFSRKIKEYDVSLKVYGHWYDLSEDVVEEIKGLHKESSGSNIFNLLVNYDHKTEVADACKVFLKKISLGKANFEKITYETVMEELYAKKLPPIKVHVEMSENLGQIFPWLHEDPKLIKGEFSEKILDKILS